jgi:hypothetical protein
MLNAISSYLACKIRKNLDKRPGNDQISMFPIESQLPKPLSMWSQSNMLKRDVIHRNNLILPFRTTLSSIPAFWIAFFSGIIGIDNRNSVIEESHSPPNV